MLPMMVRLSVLSRAAAVVAAAWLAVLLHETDAGSSPSHSAAFHCCVGQHIRIALPDIDNVVADFTPTPGQDATDGIDQGVWSGFLPNLFHKISLDMGFTYTFVPTRSPPSACCEAVEAFMNTSNTSNVPAFYSVGRQMLMAGVVDAIVDDPLQILAGDDSENFEYTVPILTMMQTALVWKETKEKSMWSMFLPFEGRLWIAIAGATTSVAVVLIILQAIEENGKHCRTCFSPSVWLKSLCA